MTTRTRWGNGRSGRWSGEADFLTDQQRAKLLSGNALRFLGRTS